MDFKKIWDYFTDNYSHLIIFPQYFFKKYNQTAIKLAPKYARGKLVDIGCGRMPYKKAFLPYVDSYLGVDSPLVSKLYKGVEKPDVLADATNLPFPKNSFSTVLSLQVVEHLQDPDKAIFEASRILKSGGHIILSTVQSYPIHDEPHDFFRYTKYGLKYLLEKNGLKVLKSFTEGNVFILGLQNFNIYLMLILKKLVSKKTTTPFAIILLPLFFIFMLISNLLGLIFEDLDKTNKFSMINTVVAIKK